MNRRSLLGAVVALGPTLAFASTNGCSGEPEYPFAFAWIDAGARRDVFQPPPPADSAPISCCGTCDAIDATKFPYRSPLRKPGSCTDAEVDAMIAFVDTNPTATFEQLQDSITNVACRECVFAEETSKWAPIVLGAASTSVVAINVGGCFTIATGEEACGRAHQQLRSCAAEACVDCPNDEGPDSFLSCVETRASRICQKAFDDRATLCGGAKAVADAEALCAGKYTFVGSVRAQCVGLSISGDGGGD